MPQIGFATLNVDKTLHQRIKISAAVAKKPINDYLNSVLDGVLVKVSDLK
jgi:predicted HicB family RNase H-like nuclease